MKVKLALIYLILITLSMPVYSGQYTALMKNACPEGWEDTTKAVPILGSTMPIPWSENSIASDKAAVSASLSPSVVIATIDPATQVDFVNDPLTIASNCLMYRNFEVDTANYIEPPAVAENLATGWIPAVMF